MKVIFISLIILWILTSAVSVFDIYRRKRVHPLWLAVIVLMPVLGPILYAFLRNCNAKFGVKQLK
jgi:hypothetical protein